MKSTLTKKVADKSTGHTEGMVELPADVLETISGGVSDGVEPQPAPPRSPGLIDRPTRPDLPDRQLPPVRPIPDRDDGAPYIIPT